MANPAARAPLHPALLFAFFFLFTFALHGPLLRLPYFWDEAGYYVPAARDLCLTGSLIPVSTPSNAHPPLVMAFLALNWKIAGFTPLVTHSAMLLVAALSLLGVFRLAASVANREVAWAATLCTALYPVFFMQSTLAQVDLAAAGLIFWGLAAHLERRSKAAALWFSLAVLAKETAVLVPLTVFGWELILRSRWARRSNHEPGNDQHLAASKSALLIPALVLGAWYAYHYLRTGYVLGNPEFFRYNVAATANPLRIALALLMRIWQAVGYMNLGLLTAATLLAMLLPPQPGQSGARPRIALPTQLTFLAVAVVYTLAMSVIGGAVLARYMLPIVPLAIIIFVSTLWRRVRYWREVIAVILVGFVVALFINPPYGFTLEDNLAYRDYILLHQRAENLLQARYPTAHVLTAWPATDEITRPALGYVTRPMKVVRIEDFTIEELMSASELNSGELPPEDSNSTASRPAFDVALIFSTKYEPPSPWLGAWEAWQKTKARFFGYHRDAPPALAARILGGEVIYTETRHHQWIAIIEINQAHDAGALPLRPLRSLR